MPFPFPVCTPLSEAPQGATAGSAPSLLPASLLTLRCPTLSLSLVLPRRQEQFQTNPDSYNGAVRENYAWSQDYSDLEIKVPVPKHIMKGKQVKQR